MAAQKAAVLIQAAESLPEGDCWRVHPAQRRPLAAVAALAAIAALAVATSLLAEDWFWGAVAAFALLLALNRFFLPSRFELAADSITLKQPLWDERIAWSAVGRFAFDESAGLLSASVRPSRFRRGGLLVQFDQPARAEQIRQRLPSTALVVDRRIASPA